MTTITKDSTRSRRRGTRLALASALLAGASLAQAPGDDPRETDWSALGFASGRIEAQRAVEEAFARALPRHRFRSHLEVLTREPHVAGTEANRRVAEYIGRVMREAGLEVTEYPYDIYMPRAAHATSRVDIVRPRRQPLSQQEDILDQDPFTEHPALGPGWNAFSGSGDVTGEVVYANYGRLEDFRRLEELGVEVEGRIVLARYGGNFRGFKARFAEDAGAVGLIIFSDPGDGGYSQGLEYPEGPNLNGSTVQRGSVLTLDWRGDPLTPFEPAWPLDHPQQADRLDPSAVPLPTIPVTPLPHGSAIHILEQMEGPAAPRDWQGALPMAYRLSGGPGLTVRVRVQQPRELVRVANVVGTIRGTERPDEWIVLGSHFDAWGFGALDPNGGTAMLLTLAEGLGELVRRGNAPRRSILIAHWDAEEYGILGSGEWVEQMRPQLERGAVAYINADGAVTGSRFSVSAAPALKELIAETTRSIRLPDGETLHAAWTGTDAATEPFGDLGGGSDHVGFYCHIGVPSAMVGFSGSAPVYHSNYDTFAWFERFADPDWIYGPTLAHLDGLLALRLANADLLPFDFRAFAQDASRHLAVIERISGTSLREARARLAKLLRAADRVRKVRRRALESGGIMAERLAEANRELLLAERRFVHPEGMPFGGWYRSLFASPDPTSGYAPWMFPGLRWAAEQADEAELQRWSTVYADAIAEMTATADRIAQQLR